MRKPPRIGVPDRAHPLIKRLFQEMAAQQAGVVEMAGKSGVNKNTLKDWRTRGNPRLADLEACFNVLGFDIIVKEIK